MNKLQEVCRELRIISRSTCILVRRAWEEGEEAVMSFRCPTPIQHQCLEPHNLPCDVERIDEYPDTLTPELAWEIETRAWASGYFIQYTFKGKSWHVRTGRICKKIGWHEHADRAQALIDALHSAIGGE